LAAPWLRLRALFWRAGNVCLVLVVLLILVAAPLGFLTSSLAVGTVCGVLLMLGGVGLALVDWAVSS